MSKPSRNSNQNNDFDVNALLSDVSNHARDMTTLTKKIECLEEKFGTNEKIAETLSDTAEKAVKMQTMLAKTFVTLLKSNDEVKEGISEIVNKLDRKYTALFLKRFSSGVWAIFLVSLGVVLKWVFDKF